MPLVHGYNGRAQFNGANFHCHRWMVNVRSAPVDVTNFLYYGSSAYAPTLKDGEVMLEVIFDDDDNPYAGALDIKPGTLASCRLYFDVTGLETAAFWNIPKLLVLGSRQGQSVRDVARYSVTARICVFTLADRPTFPGA
jgi:hypothetical protein